LTLVVACPRSPDKSKRGGAAKAAPGKSKGQLASLPYLNWVPVKPADRGRVGVTRLDPKLATGGLTLYNSLPRAEARLIDLRGKLVHRWASPVGQPTAAELEWRRIWPHLDFIGWQHVEATPAGELFVVLYLHALVKLDRASKVIWIAEVPAHHDLDVGGDGDTWTLVAEKVKLRHKGQTLRILDDLVVVLGPDGRVRRRISLLQALRRDPKTAPLLEKRLDDSAAAFARRFTHEYLLAKALQKTQGDVDRTVTAVKQILADRFAGTRRVELMLMTSMLPMDPLHANSIEVLRRDVPALGKRGDLLISVRELDLVLVLDPEEGAVRWTFGPGVLQRPHHPSLLDNGNLLVFDNGVAARRSRVVELDPRTKKVVWTYQAKPPGAFFSPIRGGCQRLPGGNTLIVESERGRAFEVTPAGSVVWEFFNPDLKDPFMERKRAPIYRMTRYPRGYLKGAAPPGPDVAPGAAPRPDKPPRPGGR
jgi:hypothetical protein